LRMLEKLCHLNQLGLNRNYEADYLFID